MAKPFVSLLLPVLALCFGLARPGDAVASGKMYWTDLGTEKIQRANLDGSNVEDLVTTGVVRPAGIALDVAGGKCDLVKFHRIVRARDCLVPARKV